MQNKYVQDKKTGKFKGSVPSAVSAPNVEDLAKVRENTQNGVEDQYDVKTDYSVLSEAVQNLRKDDPEREERRKNIISWATGVPENDYALNSYFEVLANELDTDVDDVKFRYELLRGASETNTQIAGNPDLDYVRFVVRNENRKLVGTPQDEDSCRAIADLETLAAEKRREKRSLVEKVDDDGTVWVRYTNNRLSEILRAVNYNEETKELTVQLARKTTDTNAANTSEYTYRNVHPSIVKQLVSARSMGRFYYYVFSDYKNKTDMGNIPVKDYSFVAQYSNFMWPSRGSFGGPVPSQKTLDKAKNSRVNE